MGKQAIVSPRERSLVMQLSSVLGIIEGRKRRTSRVMREQPPDNAKDVFYWWHEDLPKEACTDSGCYYWCPSGLRMIPCPYGEPGDLLWVKEAWRPRSWSEYGYGQIEDMDGVVRSVEGGEHWTINRMFPASRPDPDAWRSPRFMPRFASRLTLRITEITVQRLQDISEEDAVQEGVARLFSERECSAVVGIAGTRPADHGYENYLWHGHVGRGLSQKQADSWPYQFSNYDAARGSFSSLWEKINGPRGHGWSHNDWIWGIRFKIEELKYKSSGRQP